MIEIRIVQKKWRGTITILLPLSHNSAPGNDAFRAAHKILYYEIEIYCGTERRGEIQKVTRWRRLRRRAIDTDRFVPVPSPRPPLPPSSPSSPSSTTPSPQWAVWRPTPHWPSTRHFVVPRTRPHFACRARGNRRRRIYIMILWFRQIRIFIALVNTKCYIYDDDYGRLWMINFFLSTFTV